MLTPDLEREKGKECIVCRHNDFTYEEVEYQDKNRGSFLRRICKKCGANNGAGAIKKEQEELENIIMPFGKYKGKKLIEIYKLDPNYLSWLKDNLSNGFKHNIINFLKNKT